MFSCGIHSVGVSRPQFSRDPVPFPGCTGLQVRARPCVPASGLRPADKEAARPRSELHAGAGSSRVRAAMPQCRAQAGARLCVVASGHGADPVSFIAGSDPQAPLPCRLPDRCCPLWLTLPTLCGLGALRRQKGSHPGSGPSPGVPEWLPGPGGPQGCGRGLRGDLSPAASCGPAAAGAEALAVSADLTHRRCVLLLPWAGVPGGPVLHTVS